MFTFDDGAALRRTTRKAFTPKRRQPSEPIGREASIDLLLDILGRPTANVEEHHVRP